MKPLKFDQNGLITAVVQDRHTRDILMVAMMNAQAFTLTRETGLAHFWSRSRRQLWLKGEMSGNKLVVWEMKLDCDKDAVLLLVDPKGPACHTGAISCFLNNVEM